jgi:Spy/CpxP family protein refolding chaperone
MTSRRTTPLLLATLFLGVGLLADPAAAQSDGQAGQTGPHGPRKHHGKLLKQLDLTEEQRAQAKALFEQHKGEMQAAREARGQALRSMAEARKARRQDLAGVLNPEQRAKLERLVEAQRAKAEQHADRRVDRRDDRRDARDGRKPRRRV